MGYKSILRTVNASANRSIKEYEKKRRQEEREVERASKKIAKIKEKMEKIVESLNDQLAKGKIDNASYTKLLKRKNDIGLDLIVFGKTPAVAAAKRYICGKIEKDEFEKICSSIVPPNIIEEQLEIKNAYQKLLDEISKFKKSCNQNHTNVCQKCGKEKSLFNPLKTVEHLILCGKCKRELNQLINFKGVTGEYFFVEPQKILISDKEQQHLEVHIHSKYF
jgi:hypothetical protein